MSDLSGIRTKVIGIVSDDSGKLTNPGDYDRNIAAAIAIYSKHRPNLKVVDITGNGGHDYDLPSGWIDEFSVIKSIEYPIGDVPATLIDNDKYEIYQSPTAKKIRLINDTPSASESFRVTFTTLRTDTTIPDGDIDALCNLASALCLEELANAYAQTSDSTIAADSVNYRTKSFDFAQRAKRLMQLYKEHMGIREDDITQPASAVIDLDIKYPGGGERLTHPRSRRKMR
ncbi:hypothetical protein A45J_0402 [hot springs metagenome]|uniref:Uncharacterized protein n=1 Tax=hot springs metagenome TaxID=433727 RepID=A0A5J4KTV3_9ZZZZ